MSMPRGKEAALLIHLLLYLSARVSMLCSSYDSSPFPVAMICEFTLVGML